MKHGYRGKEIVETSDWLPGVVIILLIVAALCYWSWQKENAEKDKHIKELETKLAPAEKTLAVKVPANVKCTVFDEMQDRILIECTKPVLPTEKGKK